MGYCSAAVHVSFCGILQCSCTSVVLWDNAVQLYKCRSVGYCSATVQVSFCGILQCSCTSVVLSDTAVQLYKCRSINR